MIIISIWDKTSSLLAPNGEMRTAAQYLAEGQFINHQGKDILIGVDNVSNVCSEMSYLSNCRSAAESMFPTAYNPSMTDAEFLALWQRNANGEQIEPILPSAAETKLIAIKANANETKTQVETIKTKLTAINAEIVTLTNKVTNSLTLIGELASLLEITLA